MHHYNEEHVIHHLKHYLPAQAPLKDFIHHNTLHVFQNKKFFVALQEASEIFGFKTSLSINDYRQMYAEKKIRKDVVEHILAEKKGKVNVDVWKEKLLHTFYDYKTEARIGAIRKHWKKACRIDLDNAVHPTLFRILCSYLDQGISIWNFPSHEHGFLASLREMERLSMSSFFRNKSTKKLLLEGDLSLHHLLQRVVGDEQYFEQYLFDQQLAHQGWSGIVSVIEDNPNALIDKKIISLREFIIFELLMEIDALDSFFPTGWKPIASAIETAPIKLFDEIAYNELDEVISIWQEAFEWSYYDDVLKGLQMAQKPKQFFVPQMFQALFCIDDRECSIRRYIEEYEPGSQTYGTPGFFGVEFYFQPMGGKFHTKLCPAPVTPKYLIKETDAKGNRKNDAHFSKQSHSLVSGWLISQTLGFWSAVRLAINIFKPTVTPATSTSFRHMNKLAKLTIEHTHDTEGDLQVGFTVPEMVTRVENLLRSIGLVSDFAPLVYIVGHGASSVNNTHYAGYDCGACSGRPGSVNARVMSYMCNHVQVRIELQKRGIDIPASTQFIGALHDTTRDEIEFYDEDDLIEKNRKIHQQNILTFEKALHDNAKERSRRFELTPSEGKSENVHERVKLRSVSLFEPRPEYNHATNTLCIVGRRELTNHVFLDRRSFLNSYNYAIDLDGKILFNILKPIGPVCGGINLEYYFSRVDNQKLGAGSKLPHNVMGLIGVANGTDGDLRPGLPGQMVEIHDPVRLMLIVEHFPEVVLSTIKQAPEVYEWYINEWIHLIAIHPESRELFRFNEGAFHSYHPLRDSIPSITDVRRLFEKSSENIPVYQLQ